MTVPETIACARIDAHAHLHPGVDAAAFLASAHRNAQGHPLLCLTESAGVDRFAELRRVGRAGAWRVEPTEEPESAVAEHDGRIVVLVSGRQVITAERLEVLALATRAELPDGRPLEATIDAVLDARAIPVLPWAFGKWWGERGEIAERAVRTRDDLLVADQAGRPRTATEHRILKLARRRGIPVLAGSDPLALPHHDARPAAYGFTFAPRGAHTFPLNARTPAADLRARLAEPEPALRIVGARIAFPSFVRDQISLRVRARRERAR